MQPVHANRQQRAWLRAPFVENRAAPSVQEHDHMQLLHMGCDESAGAGVRAAALASQR
jgi:hypothetical protein